MGTRGAFGVIVGETEKIGYNQFDSYPEGMGVENLRWLRDKLKEHLGLDELILLAKELRVVSSAAPPTAEDVARLAGVTDLGVSEGSTSDWYCLTRHTHGDIGKTLECGYVLDSHKFPLGSLFCEWAYIVDLDAGVFEAYRGFTTAPPKTGRWAGRTAEVQSDYYAVELAASWPLDGLPTDEEFVAALGEDK